MKKLFALTFVAVGLLLSLSEKSTAAPPNQSALSDLSAALTQSTANLTIVLAEEDRAPLPPVEFPRPLFGALSSISLTLGTALIVGLVGAVLLGLMVRHRSRSRPDLYLANIAEGTHVGGRSTYKSDSVVANTIWGSNGRASILGRRGATADAVDICGAANVPIGFYLDEVKTAGDKVAFQHFGAVEGTVKMVASAAIAQDALLEPAAGGKVATLAGGAGTHHVVGRALQAAAADGDVIEVDVFYFLRVI